MTWRYRTIFIVITILFSLVILKLFYWQLVKAEELADLGQSQYGNYITLTPTRGEIQTSDRFSIVANRTVYLVFANPKEVKNKEQTALVLSQLLNRDSASISAALSQDKFWVPIKSGVDAKTKSQIEQLGLLGVGFEQLSTRFYPEASLAAQLTGFVGKDDLGSDKGYFGLEGFYDRQLRGKSGIGMQIHDAFGRPILAQMNDNTRAIDGRTLVLHIDRSVQYIAENELKDSVEKFGASGGLIIIMDPKTGGILAMAASPSFDQATFSKFSADEYKNPAVTNLYEPGSTFKALVMAAALDDNLVKPDTQCDICAGPVSVGGYDIHTWNNQYQQGMTMVDVIRHSDNTGMVFVSKKLGLDKMLSYFEKFGVTDLTGIDLQGEIAPGEKPKEDWHTIDVATASFGQGIVMTPLELLDAFSSLANDGKRMEPHVVSKIITPDGQTIDLPPKMLSQTVKSETAKVMTEILVNAVNKGEAQFARVKGYRIAGKTGTAQIPIAGHYDPNKTIASFIGFAPADNPRFAMLVVIDRPTTSIYGAETAAPVFFNVARSLFDYYKIPPTVNE